MACISTGNIAPFYFYARTGDVKALRFWMWIILPLSTTAMAISFVLKPRRKDWAYKVSLVLQYVMFAFVSEYFYLVGHDFAKSTSILASVRSLVWLALLKFGLMCRNHIATLSDEDLSNFLANDVVFGGMIIGSGQCAFLMFASIQCDGNTDNWRQCKRTLYSQLGLSSIVTLYTIIKLASGVVPKRILKKHVISPKKVLAMDLNAEEAVQAFGLLISAGCTLYPLGNYGARGDFGSNADGKAERYAALVVPSIGGFCLLLTAVWKLPAIRGEMRREAEETGQVRQVESSSDSKLVEASSFWFYIGVLATTYQSAVNIAGAVTMDKSYQTLSTASLPIVGLLYIGSITCQPRRWSPKDIWKLRLHFASFAFIGEMAWAVHGFREGDFGNVITRFALLAAETLCFHFILKLRAAVGRLPDEDLDLFLVDTLFKSMLQTLFSILFLTFRTTKCMFEEGNAAVCNDTSLCSTMISLYLLGWWLTKLVQGSVRSEWRNELNLSVEKIARMRDISLRRGLAGFLTLAVGVCGIFLFSMMSADRMDYTTITVVGLTGLAATVGIFISEMYTSFKAQRRRFGRDQDEEYRAKLAETMKLNRGRPLTEDQVAVFARCEKLEDAIGEGWRRLKKQEQCPDLTTWSKYDPTKKGEIAAGKAIAIVDSSVEKVAAWVMDACGNEKMRISREEGNPARLVLTEEDGYPQKDNEITLATVKRMPFFLNDREFVVRMIWRSDEGKMSIATESIDDNVDVAYGRKLRKTRGFTRALWEFENLPQRDVEGEGEGENQQRCKATLVQIVDPGGSIPAWVTNRKITYTLSAVQEVINQFWLVRKNRTSRGTMNGHQEDFEGGERATEIEEPIEECSWVYVCVSFLFTSTFSGLYISYGVTLEDKYWLWAGLIQPIVALSFVMALFSYPKRTDASYISFLYFHFFTFAVASEIGVVVGNFRLGLIFGGLFALFRLPLWSLAFWLGLKLRASAAKLPPQELSDFLCQTVLLKGTAAMGTMLFFSFEAVACFISQKSFDNGQCENTSLAATSLSISLAILTTLSIVNKSVPKSVHREMAFELSSIASLKGLKWWQQIQGGLMTITAIVSLYLLSILGVEGDENFMVFAIGAMGGISIGFAFLINATMLVRTRKKHQRNSTSSTELPPHLRSAQGFSARDIEENSIALALV
ncbi:hypothetical protein TrST_g13759 [Triparma strigata]|uniref:START domain-containing protein n=1 Tax=Triparma strigata TaxID=1606541 RepID=A0A9W6ZXS0_9STRA|nr:hypothetical protein TrST_g13759 [Triparma strigata]